MGNYDNKRGGGRDFGRPNFQKKSWGGNDRGERKELFRATCADCGKSCEVPFRPNGSKPVYCQDCFGTKGGRSPETFPKKEWREERAPENKSNREVAELKIQVAELGRKIDHLTQAIEALAKPKAPEVKEAVKETKVDLATTVKKAIAKSVSAPAKKSEKTEKKKAPAKKGKK